MREYRVGKSGVVAFLAMTMGIADVSANGFRNPPESAAGLGQVGSRMTLVEDPSAISYNPANLTGVELPTGMGSLMLVRSRTEFDSPDGRSGKTRGSLTFLPNLHGAWPIDDEWVAGLGITTPFGQSTEWRKDGPFRYVAPHFAEMTTVAFMPSVAGRIGDDISVGLSANVYWSELDLRQMVPWAMAAGFPGAPDGELRLKGDGIGFGANVGVTWQMTDRQRVALVYKSPFDVEYDGTTSVGNVPPPLGMMVAGRSDFDAEIKFPTIVAFGYGLQVTEKIRAGIDVEWIEFSRFSELPLDVGVNNATGLVPPSVPQDWKDTWTVGVGGDWSLAAPWTVRGGYIFMESPVPSRTLAPTLPDADRHLLSVGVSYERGVNAVDFAYAYSIFDDLNVRNNVEPAFNGDYDLSSHLFQLSYRRIF